MVAKYNRLRKVIPLLPVLLVLVELVVLYSIGQNVYAFFYPQKMGFLWSGDALGPLPLYAGVFISLIFMFGFLRSLTDIGTVFSRKNVLRLRLTSFVLLLIEPLHYLLQLLLNKLRPLTPEGFRVTTVSSLGGVILISGLIIFSVAAAFEYGTALQKESDETL